MTQMSPNPLGDYLDALLTQPANAAADWDNLLREAVEPHRQSSQESSSSFVFAASTILKGREPVICHALESLPCAGRLTHVLDTLSLARTLPESRLRQCLLNRCEGTLLMLNDRPLRWSESTMAPLQRVP